MADTTPDKPGKYLLHGVVITARLARSIVSDPAFRDMRTRARTLDTELYLALRDIYALAVDHTDYARVSDPRKPTEAETPLKKWTPREAATQLGIGEHAVRLAIKKQMITADKINGRWAIDPDSARRYNNRHTTKD